MPYRTLRMSYRRRGNRDASLADTFSKTETQQCLATGVSLSDFFFVNTLAICTSVTKPRQNPMTPAPINTPQIIPTAAAYRVNDAPSGGENNPLTNAGEIRATTEANAPPTTADSRAAPRTER